MPPGARPWIRPDTVTVIVGSWRIRASMRASAWTNARSSPDANRRNAAGALECRNGDGEAGTGRLGMARPGIRGVRIKPGSKLVLQFCQLAFKCIVGVEMRWDECCLGWIDRHPSAHQIGAGRQGQEVTLDPIRRDDGIGIRCQKDAVVTREFGGVCHCQPRAHCRRWRPLPRRCGLGCAADTEGAPTAPGQPRRCGRYSCWPARGPHRLAWSAGRAPKDKPRYDQLRPWRGSRQRWGGWIDTQVKRPWQCEPLINVPRRVSSRTAYPCRWLFDRHPVAAALAILPLHRRPGDAECPLLIAAIFVPGVVERRAEICPEHAAADDRPPRAEAHRWTRRAWHTHTWNHAERPQGTRR